MVTATRAREARCKGASALVPCRGPWLGGTKTMEHLSTKNGGDQVKGARSTVRLARKVGLMNHTEHEQRPGRPAGLRSSCWPFGGGSQGRELG